MSRLWIQDRHGDNSIFSFSFSQNGITYTYIFFKKLRKISFVSLRTWVLHTLREGTTLFWKEVLLSMRYFSLHLSMQILKFILLLAFRIPLTSPSCFRLFIWGSTLVKSPVAIGNTKIKEKYTGIDSSLLYFYLLFYFIIFCHGYKKDRYRRCFKENDKTGISKGFSLIVEVFMNKLRVADRDNMDKQGRVAAIASANY